MARYTGAACRLCRREGLKLFLKGERCYTDKCAIERRTYPPGEHGQGRQKFSEYSIQLRDRVAMILVAVLAVVIVAELAATQLRKRIL